MDYAPGGDVRTLISNIGPFSEEESKFYISEMILAVITMKKHDVLTFSGGLSPRNWVHSQVEIYFHS